METIGQSVPRREDFGLLTGRTPFIADLTLDGMLEACLVRSTEAHARIVEIDTTNAKAAPGVVAVFSGADLDGKVAPFTRHAITTPPHVAEAVGLVVKSHRAEVIPASIVRRVGEPVAVVVAENRYQAEDAAELIAVSYDPMPVVTDPEAALAADAPVLHPELGDNLHSRFRIVVGDPDDALARAPHRLHRRLRMGRSVGSPIETRGVAARFDEPRNELTVWATTQRSHWLRDYIAEMVGLPHGNVRVIAPAMGGSFGSGLYSEDILVAYLALHLRRPVRWIEDRRENLANARHARDQIHDVEVGYDDDGRIQAIHDRFLMDCGAYNPYAVTISYNVASNLRSQYRIDHMDVEGLCVLTNKLPNTPVRGAGRPEATFVMERVIEMVAQRLGRDPVEIRRLNLIPAELMPYDMGMLYRDGNQMVYDSGDFPEQLERALAAVDYETFRAWQVEQREAGRHVGLGVACHVEGSGIGPFEGAKVRIDESGHVVVASGSNSHGQSHETVLAQVCSDALGVPVDRITVHHGDTQQVAYGGGTNASRSGVTASMAVTMGAETLRDKVLAVAGQMLEADPADLELRDGVVSPRGVPSVSLALADVAQAASPGPGMPDGIGAGLEASAYYRPPAVTFASSTHVAIVEVDPDTGLVTILRYVVVDDCGRELNPAVVDGQQHGGVAHGIGNGLFEEAVYDEAGQLLNPTFMDYLLPTSADVPLIEVIHDNHPTPLNPLGVKGVGEGGTTSAPAALANAIADAMKPLDLEVDTFPLTPARVKQLIDTARLAGS
ncbi:MAG TPA: xanthine dehydrogenase family protein molybdopterin-binding subunit [Acidimicrobiia bacterium]|nr:xanthine dehydrogenase family protein molybdopterin-binding subunit [Acidimicrobiia bacterium]